MFRSTLIAAGAVALCGVGFAQQRLDPANVHPITVPIRDAGVFNWQTKQWVSGPMANKHLATQYTVFNNTCNSTIGAYYFGLGGFDCWDVISSGQIPATDTPMSSYPGYDANGVHIASGLPLSGATDDQNISSFQFGYCTFVLTGTVDIVIGFYDNLRGDCANGIPVEGKPYNMTLASQAIPFGTGTAYFDFGSAAGNPLPGTSTVGTQACWTVTIGFLNNAGFCMPSEGDGSWDNDDDLDAFSWSFENNNAAPATGQNNGPIIAGEPLAGGWGAGAYNIPTGSDPIGGTPCGTGNNMFDGWFMNIDGSSPNVPGPCSPTTTGCYWFGGWPGNPFGSFWMVMGSHGSCAGCSNRSSTYCTAGTTADGCQALIASSGTSSATASSGFFVNASAAPGNKSGLFFYGTLGPKSGGATSWGQTSSFQCIQPPVKRDAQQTSTGTTGQCDGSFSTDLNARWAAKPTHNPGAGAQVDGQWWFRDPAGPAPDTALSNAITWTVCP
jgi:hypothetical protein